MRGAILAVDPPPKAHTYTGGEEHYAPPERRPSTCPVRHARQHNRTHANTPTDPHHRGLGRVKGGENLVSIRRFYEANKCSKIEQHFW